MSHNLRLEWRRPEELNENPRNWRTHPGKQLSALKDVMVEVGWAGALLYNETTGRLVDGHARRKVARKGELVPVLIGSWTEEQERLILATLDPIAAMAEGDKEQLAALLHDVDTGSAAIQSMLSELAEEHDIIPSDTDADPGLDLGPEKWMVVVDCADEHHQAELLDRFSSEGLQCKALMG